MMGNSFADPGDFRIEISGWGVDNRFFVEPTELRWTSNGEKQVQLRRTLAEGSVVFLRLLVADSSNQTVPLAYEVEQVTAMDCEGVCRISLKQLHPRSKESQGKENASKFSEDWRRARNVLEDIVAESQYEEVLQ
jgi:hypothetical protein